MFTKGAMRRFNTAKNKAKWLNDSEKALLANEIQHHQAASTHSGFGAVLKDPWVYFMAFAYFTIISGIYAIGFWLPSLIKSSGIDNLNTIGWLSAIPYLLSAVFMIVFAKTSDKMQERKWHSVLAAVAAAALLIVSVVADSNFTLAFIAIAVATGLMWASYTIFWAIPSKYLKGSAAAGGIALINSIGLLGGFVSPNIMGMAKEMTNSLMAGWVVMAVMLVLGGVSLLIAFAIKKEA